MTTLDLPVVGTTVRAAAWTRILCVLFFFSGFPALIYQLTWQQNSSASSASIPNR